MEAISPDIFSWRLLATEDGIQVRDSILWLDARFTGDLSFLSSASSLSGRTTARIITTEETAKLLALNNIKLNALICPYNQSVSLGQLRMELLPTGAGLGGASLWVEQHHGSLLYAPQLQPQKTGLTRIMQLKHADTLILGAQTPFPAHQYSSRKKEKERLLLAVQAHLAAGVYPIIFCEPYAIAQEICKLLTEANIQPAVHKSIERINRIYELYGSKLGPYSLWHKRMRDRRVLILPAESSAHPKSQQPLPEGPVLYIDDAPQQNSWPDLTRSVSERFFISRTCDGRELKNVINTVKPRKVYVTGPYAKSYVDELHSSRIEAFTLFPRHLPTLL